jgi:hypothetical protein
VDEVWDNARLDYVKLRFVWREGQSGRPINVVRDHRYLAGPSIRTVHFKQKRQTVEALRRREIKIAKVFSLCLCASAVDFKKHGSFILRGG